jgi:signal transduction histidine kinase
VQVTRAEGDAARLKSQQVDLAELLAELVEDGRLEADRRGCDIKLDHEPVTVPADRELLRRALENILRNAIRYSPPETTIRVRLLRSGDRAVIAVRDFGPGVPEESLNRIFNAFYRVEPDRDRASGGVGLGLSIARRAIELHHGTVSARNANPGLIVEISLPFM